MNPMITVGAVLSTFRFSNSRVWRRNQVISVHGVGRFLSPWGGVLGFHFGFLV